MIKDRRSDEKSLFISGDDDVAAVKHELRAFVDTFLYPVADKLFMLCVDDRSELCFGIVRAPDFELLRFFLEERDEFEGKKVDAATTISRADELLKTQKLDVKSILSEAEKMSDSDGAEDKSGQ